jgi:predicted Zn-dependent peptidase
MEDSLSIAEFNAASQLFTSNGCDVGEHLEKINKVSLHKIKEVAKFYLTEPEPNISLVGPVKD